MFDVPALAPEGIRRLSRAEYERMVGLGMFEDERVELLYGVLCAMSPQGAPHATVAAWIHRELVLALGRAFDVRGHSPFAASDDSEPEPDIMVAKRVEGFSHPSAPLLVIEVSESSIRKDRGVKARLYAEASVPEYWLVDLTGDDIRVDVHLEPSPDGYRTIETLGPDRVLRPTLLPSVAIAIADMPWHRA